MIPSDLAARLRTLTEASFFNTDPPVPGLQRARAIQSQLPDLVPGARFFATLQRALPDGTFNAVVAGRQMTLALNSSALPGDTLELEVTQTTPRAVFARVLNVETTPQSTANVSAQPTLSSTGRLISFLLTGQPEPQPARLADNRPLLPSPPTTPTQTAQLVPMLRQAVSQSGLFYESHQTQWVLGKLDTAALLREPQGQASPPTTQANPNPGRTATPAPTAPAAQGAAPAQSAPAGPGNATSATASAANVLNFAGNPAGGTPLAGNPVASNLGTLANLLVAAGMPSPTNTAAVPGQQNTPPLPGQPMSDTAADGLRPPASALDPRASPPPGSASPSAPSSPNTASATNTAERGTAAGAQPGAASDQAATVRSSALPIPDRLLPVVHQQLDALATQQYIWQGQAWPGQMMEWEIEDPERDGAEGETAEANWNTTLRLTLPRLGGVEASLHLTPAGVALRLRADEGALQALDSGAAALASALEAANLKLTGLVVERREPRPATSPVPAQ